MLRESPWPHIVVDDFLPSDVLSQSWLELGCDTYEYEMESRGTGRIEYSLLKSKSLWTAIYSKRTLALLSDAFGVALALNRDNMLQLRRMNEVTPEFPIHNDFTRDGDRIASFLYLSPNWAPEFGGRIHLYNSGDQIEPSASIEPIANRFFAFRTDASHWHSVDAVRGWERLSVLSLWDIAES